MVRVNMFGGSTSRAWLLLKASDLQGIFDSIISPRPLRIAFWIVSASLSPVLPPDAAFPQWGFRAAALLDVEALVFIAADV